jgi:hypothetical protein
MTLIVSDGNYMFADKHRTGTHTITGTRHSPKVTFNTNLAEKIYRFPEGCMVGDFTCLVMAVAGNVKHLNAHRKALDQGFNLEELFQIDEYYQTNLFTETNFMFITDEGKTIVCDWHNDRPVKTVYANGAVVSIGQPTVAVGTFREMFDPDKRPSALDSFLYGTTTSSVVSREFDYYSREKDIIHYNQVLSRRQVKLRFDKLQKSINLYQGFYRIKYSH